MRYVVLVLSVLFLAESLLLVRPGLAQVPPPAAGGDALAQEYTGRVYSPYAERDFPGVVYWGDTHLHTSFSMDAAISSA